MIAWRRATARPAKENGHNGKEDVGKINLEQQLTIFLLEKANVRVELGPIVPRPHLQKPHISIDVNK
jgi:hypothetical protein